MGLAWGSSEIEGHRHDPGYPGSSEEQPVPGSGLRCSVVPVVSMLMMYSKVSTWSPLTTPVPPRARGSVRALITWSVSVLVVWAWAGGAGRAPSMAIDRASARAPETVVRQPERSTAVCPCAATVRGVSGPSATGRPGDPKGGSARSRFAHRLTAATLEVHEVFGVAVAPHSPRICCTFQAIPDARTIMLGEFVRQKRLMAKPSRSRHEPVIQVAPSGSEGCEVDLTRIWYDQQEAPLEGGPDLRRTCSPATRLETVGVRGCIDGGGAELDGRARPRRCAANYTGRGRAGRPAAGH